jgi:hypothetical protein
LQGLIEREWPAPKMQAQQELFALLGLLPRGTDLNATLTAVLDEQVGGLYDPASGTMLIGRGMSGDLLEVVLAHELTHALDDQLYGLAELQELARSSTDLSFALSAVVEGSGTLVMNRYLLEAAGRDPSRLTQLLAESGRQEAARGERLSAAPAFVQRNLLLAYLLGPTFLTDSPAGMLGLLTDPGAPSAQRWEQAFMAPPLSSEQILHPERFWDPARRDLPQRLIVPDVRSVLGSEWRALEADTLGELNAAILTDSSEPAAPAPGLSGLLGLMARSDWTNSAADGWDGDTAILCAAGPRRAALWISIWENGAEAAEFLAAYRTPPDAEAATLRVSERVAVVVGVEDAAAAAQRLLERAQVVAATPLDRRP